MRILVAPSRNSCTTRSRSECSISPCTQWHEVQLNDALFFLKGQGASCFVSSLDLKVEVVAKQTWQSSQNEDGLPSAT
eukprot:scaffold303409_cov21-Tisochrysis_lutea.AAC.2